jgi:hypothetical protein
MGDAPSSVSELAAEIGTTRVRISRSLARLDRDYALRHLFVSAEHAVVGADIGTAELKKMVRRNGIPLVFIAVGLGWIAYGDRAGVGAMARVAAVFGPLRNLAVELGVLPRSQPDRSARSEV